MKKIIILLIITFSTYLMADNLFESQSTKIIDSHVHLGPIGQMNPTGIQFIMKNLPDNAKLYAPASMAITNEPYTPNLGIIGQMDMAGIDHVVLLATYTHRTVGYFTNAQLLEVLSDERNVLKDGVPTFVGLASINVDNIENPDIAAHRLAALSSYLEKYPSLFVGIKLAHPHQQIAFNDPATYGIYEVAAKHQVPVLLHTGFSPFPGTSVEPTVYDPINLMEMVKQYNGQNGFPKVKFIFAHAGTGDKRSVTNALEMCRDNENIYLELSALGGNFKIDIDGNFLPENKRKEAQLPYVLNKIKEYGLVGRTIFATDGPQYSGMLKKYLEEVKEQLKKNGFSESEKHMILYENSFNLFFNQYK